MAKVNFSRKEFEKHVKITPEIEEKIALFGTPLESLTKEEIEIEIFPNRPDLLSLQGYLRGFLAFIGKKKGLKEYKIQKSNAKIIVDKSVAKVRPFSMAAIVKGVKFDDEKIKEIMQWQEKIHGTIGRNRKKVALGYYMLDKIKFPIKYITKNPKEIVFEPLDMPEKMNATQILTRHPCGRDYGNQLKGFDKFPVYYDGNNEVLSMPPIINSNKSGKVLPGTSDILIECSGTDLETLKKVISIAVVDLIDMGGKAYSVDIMYGNKKESIDLIPEKIKIKIENANKLLGLNLKEKDIKPLLEKMGYDYKNQVVSIPAWRTDIMHEVDIIEDIAIAYGYEKFVPEIPEISTVGEEDKKEPLKRKLAEILIGQNMLQVSSYHLVTKEELKKLGIKPEIEVEASKTDYSILRPNLSCQSLKILSENVDKEYPQKIFEIGPVFNLDNKQETGIKESERLCISLVPGNFTEAKQILEYLERMLNIDLKIESAEHPLLISGRTGRITYKGRTIGFIGELHPNMLKKLHLQFPVALIEISLEEILQDKIK